MSSSTTFAQFSSIPKRPICQQRLPWMPLSISDNEVRSNKLLDEGQILPALESIATLEDDLSKVQKLISLPSYFSITSPEEHILQTIEVAQTIKPEELRQLTLWKIAIDLGKKGGMPWVSRYVDLMPLEEINKAEALMTIAIALARSEDTSVDSNFANQLLGVFQKHGFGAGLSADNIGSNASLVAIAIKNSDFRFWTIHDVAVIFAERGEISQALWIIPYLDSEPFPRKDYVVRNVAIKLAEVKSFSEALDIAQSINDSFYRSQALHEIAVRLAEAGDVTRSLTIGQTIEDCAVKASALTKIAAQYNQINQSEQPISILSQALQIATEEIDNYLDKAESLIEIAMVYRDAGKPEEALSILHQTLQVFETIEVERNKLRVYPNKDGWEAKVLTMIIREYRELNQNKLALKLLPKALEYVQTIAPAPVQNFPIQQDFNTKEYSIKMSALGDIAWEYRELGQIEKAKEIKSEISYIACGRLEFFYEQPPSPNITLTNHWWKQP